jgi:hypothetical protein
MWKLLKVFSEKGRGSRSCFLAADFSEARLLALTRNEVQLLLSFFNNLQPLDPNETALWQDVSETGDAHLFRNWCRVCLKQRKGYAALEMLPLQVDDPQMIRLLQEQSWTQGLIVTSGQMTDVYAYLLQGLDQYLQVPLLPGTNDIWLIATITLGPVPLHGYDPNDPLNLATQRAARAGVTVVVAAGNEGQLIEGNSLNPWSVAPWVIGVGAASADGSQLLETSSRGVAGQEFRPSVVAPGRVFSRFRGLDHGHIVALEYIEQAAPGTMDMAVVGGKTYQYFKEAENRILIGQTGGPLVPLEEILGFLQNKNLGSPGDVEGTSFAAEYISALCQRLVKHLEPRLTDLALEERPKLLKILLEDMAQPISTLPLWEIGKGLVTSTIAHRYLDTLSDMQLEQLRRRVSEALGSRMKSESKTNPPLS